MNINSDSNKLKYSHAHELFQNLNNLTLLKLLPTFCNILNAIQVCKVLFSNACYPKIVDPFTSSIVTQHVVQFEVTVCLVG